MQISDALKAKFLENDGAKLFTINFPDIKLRLDNNNIYADSINLRESILEGSSIEFVGCIASTFSCELHGVTKELKGQRIEVYVTIEGFESERVPLFTGFVDSVKTRLTDSYKAITCYDDIYKLSDKDVAGWYKKLSFPITIKELRDSLFRWLGVDQIETSLPNDNLSINRQYAPTSMNALSIIKNICQLNGVFGVMNRQAQFEYRNLSGDTQGTYPASYTFPALNLYPYGSAVTRATDTDTSIMVSYYQDMMYEDFDVYAIDKVTVRDHEDDSGQSYGSGSNCYIVQGNVFTFGLSDDEKKLVAQNILSNVQGFSYKPFDSTCVGLPFVECGSLVRFNIADYSSGSASYVTKDFFVMQRQLKGIQAMTDTYSADGEQYQKTFISDLNTRLDSLQNKVATAVTVAQMKDFVSDFTYPKEEIDKQIEDEISKMETPTGFTVESCYTLPSKREPNTIYLVRGMVHIL